jgi:hypothetical protein
MTLPSWSRVNESLPDREDVARLHADAVEF